MEEQWIQFVCDDHVFFTFEEAGPEVFEGVLNAARDVDVAPVAQLEELAGWNSRTATFMMITQIARGFSVALPLTGTQAAALLTDIREVTGSVPGPAHRLS
jgi:hypothetical protein